MSIIRVHKTKDYSLISNEPMRDERLSWEARGIMAYLLTKPDDWVVRNSDLENRGPAGQKKVRRILSELKRFSYINRQKERQEDGTYLWVTDIYETPSLNPTYGGEDDKEPSIYPKKAHGDTILPKSTSGLATDGKGSHVVSTESPNTDSPSTDFKDSQEEKTSIPNSVRKHAESIFKRETGLRPNGNKKRQGTRWWTPLRQICLECARDDGYIDTADVEKLIQVSVSKMRKDALTISAPQSILEVAIAIAADARGGRFDPASAMTNKQKLDQFASEYERTQNG